MTDILKQLRAQARRTQIVVSRGRVAEVEPPLVRVAGLASHARVGDRLRIGGTTAEIVGLSEGGVRALAGNAGRDLGIGAAADLLPPLSIAPDDSWLGRIVDSEGRPLDSRPLAPGPTDSPLDGPPPAPAGRRPMGVRLDTGLCLFDTLLPIARGQRIGLFAGAGVGKSTLLARLVLGVAADVVVVALVGERGREVRQFVERTLGPAGMACAVVVAETADRPALARRRCAQAALAIAEHFRDAGRHVLLAVDSVTRMAEAHREVALAAGEAVGPGGHPPSLTPLLARLVERAGPGQDGANDITGLFSVLVEGSDMDGPVADALRGILDGHVVLSREIAERGRFPAVDVLRSVSRCLPDAASESENALISRARSLLANYEEAAPMIRAGLYEAGSDPEVDAAIAANSGLSSFLTRTSRDGASESFARLEAVVGEAPREAGV